MDSELVNYFKNLRVARKKLSRTMESVMKNEEAMYKKILTQERQMSREDGLGYTDEEIEANAMRQMETSPFRAALKNAQDEFEEALNIG